MYCITITWFAEKNKFMLFKVFSSKTSVKLVWSIYINQMNFIDVFSGVILQILVYLFCIISNSMFACICTARLPMFVSSYIFKFYL